MVFFQTNDDFVVLGVGGKGQADSTDQMFEDTIDKKGGIRRELTHPPQVQSLSDGPLQHVGLSDAF